MRQRFPALFEEEQQVRVCSNRRTIEEKPVLSEEKHRHARMTALSKQRTDFGVDVGFEQNVVQHDDVTLRRI